MSINVVVVITVKRATMIAVVSNLLIRMTVVDASKRIKDVLMVKIVVDYHTKNQNIPVYQVTIVKLVSMIVVTVSTQITHKPTVILINITVTDVVRRAGTGLPVVAVYDIIIVIFVELASS